MAEQEDGQVPAPREPVDAAPAAPAVVLPVQADGIRHARPHQARHAGPAAPDAATGPVRIVPGPRHAVHPPPRHAVPPPGVVWAGPPAQRQGPPGRHAWRPPPHPPVAYAPPLPPAPARHPGWLLPVVLCGVIVLAGSALAGVATVAVSAGQSAGAASVAAGAGDGAFLAALAEQPSFPDIPDPTLIEIGRGICSAMEDGASRPELVSAAVSAGFGSRDARVLVDAAHDAYCPGE